MKISSNALKLFLWKPFSGSRSFCTVADKRSFVIFAQYLKNIRGLNAITEIVHDLRSKKKFRRVVELDNNYNELKNWIHDPKNQPELDKVTHIRLDSEDIEKIPEELGYLKTHLTHRTLKIN